MIYEFFPVPVLIKQLPQDVIDEALQSSSRVDNQLDDNQDGHFNNYSVLHEGVDVPKDYPLLYKEICTANKEFFETNYPRGRAIEVFRRFHFVLIKGQKPKFYILKLNRF